MNRRGTGKLGRITATVTRPLRWRDLVPRPYLELDEELNLRAGIEWVPEGENVLGVELSRKLSGDVAEVILPTWERLRAKGLVD